MMADGGYPQHRRGRHRRAYSSCPCNVRQRSLITLLFCFWIGRRVFESFESVVSMSVMQEDESIKPPATKTPKHSPEILLYITTHFSDQHIRYFHCCWPKLVSESPLLSSAHILIVASNSTPIPQAELDYLNDELFSRNPSYELKVLPTEDWRTKCAKYQNETVRGNNPLKTPVNYKQCVANLGVQVGFQHGWVYNTTTEPTTSFDWMIRINPDVLIRKSSWLLQTMSTTLVQGVFAICNNRQLHTDFFAVRPSILPNTAFSEMGIKATKLNHERTAYREFKHLLEDNSSFKLLPDIDPSVGSCRVRGASASVYHVHDSCLAGDNEMHCTALDGWNLQS